MLIACTRGDNKRAPKLTLKIALTAAMILTPLQAFVGDLHGLNTFEHQPQKVAAMEGVWQTEKGRSATVICYSR